jgi:uncharacterized peroxidase-related enzyme
MGVRKMTQRVQLWNGRFSVIHQENPFMSATPLVNQLKPIDHASAEGKAKEILDIALKQVGFIPNMYANMANAPGVLSTYLHGYGLFRSESGLKPAEQEVVFLAVSQVNGCKYCTAAHSMIAEKMSGVPVDVLKAIRAQTAIPGARLATLYATTVAMVESHGQPSPDTVKTFLAAGYKETDLMYIVLAIAVKTLSNFSNHLFATPVDERFAAYKVD